MANPEVTVNGGLRVRLARYRGYLKNKLEISTGMALLLMWPRASSQASHTLSYLPVAGGSPLSIIFQEGWIDILWCKSPISVFELPAEIDNHLYGHGCRRGA